jgi:cutinase
VRSTPSLNHLILVIGHLRANTFGDSQGGAVNHRAIEDLDSATKNQIAAVVMFGDTQYRADNFRIPNFPVDKIKVFCGGVVRDTVCDGNLAAAVLAPHLSYGGDAREAGRFLVGKINAVLRKREAEAVEAVIEE